MSAAFKCPRSAAKCKALPTYSSHSNMLALFASKTFIISYWLLLILG